MILVDWYSPGYKAGGPIQSCVNIVNALYRYYDIYVLTSDTDHGEKEPYTGIESNTWLKEVFPGISVYYTRKATLKKKQVRELINEIEPDFIYLNHIYSPVFVVYPLWLKWRNKIAGKVILCPRGALHKGALAVKTYKKLPFLFLLRWLGINKKILFHATNEKERGEIERFFPGSNIMIANNLPESDQPELVFCEKRPGELKCLFISRLVPIKNVVYLLNVLGKIKSNMALTIAGPVEDKDYWDACLKKISELPSNIAVKYIGSVQKSEMQKIYHENHLFVLPTTGENFGHSIFESFLFGRPVLISDRTPWKQLQQKNIGWDIPLNEPESFVKQLEVAAAWEQKDFESIAAASWNFAHNFINDQSQVEKYKLLFS